MSRKTAWLDATDQPLDLVEAWLEGFGAASRAREAMAKLMFAAAWADGSLQPEERTRLVERLETLPILAALPAERKHALWTEIPQELSQVAQGKQWLRDTVKPLRFRADRVVSYGLAVELCSADRELKARELAFLRSLREALGLPEDEARELYERVQSHGALVCLEEALGRMRAMLPWVVDGLVAMALVDGRSDARERRVIVRVLEGSTELGRNDRKDLDEAIERSWAKLSKRTRSWEELPGELALGLQRPSDRFWMVVYLEAVLCADAQRHGAEELLLQHFAEVLGLGPLKLALAKSLAADLMASPELCPTDEGSAAGQGARAGS